MMPKPGYLGLRLTHELTRLLDTIGAHLHIPPGARGGNGQVVLFGLRYTAQHLGLLDTPHADRPEAEVQTMLDGLAAEIADMLYEARRNPEHRDDLLRRAAESMLRVIPWSHGEGGDDAEGG